MEFRKHPERWIKHLISAPFIYSVFFPVLLLDIFLEIYHRVGFVLYGINYVKRSEYIAIDRHKLSYLSGVEKINCMYCGYVNGFFAYAVAIAGETEKYWCGIHHDKKNKKLKHTPKHHKKFLDYNKKREFFDFVNTHSRQENRLASWLLVFVIFLFIVYILFLFR